MVLGTGPDMKISVFGTGYLGATHAACLAAAGHDVVGVDSDPGRVATLRRGRAPFHEDGLDDLIADGLARGRLRFTCDISSAASASVHFLCVGTPGADSGQLDLTALWQVLDDLAPWLRPGSLVVGRSTVPIGTTAEVRDRLAARAPAGVALAWNPEFLREGLAVQDSLWPHRIVVGVQDQHSAATLRRVYADWLDRDIPFLTTAPASAVLAKLAANTMLAIRVSTANALAEISEVAGAQIGEVVDVLGTDPRIGRGYLQPGLGYGGSCLPKDLRGLAYSARHHGLDETAAFLDGVDGVNLHQRRRLIDLALDLLGEPQGRRVAVLGVTFKPGSDDLRDSPALAIAQGLQQQGASVTVHDPTQVELPGLACAGDPLAACQDADLVLVLTDWPEYAELDPTAVAVRARGRCVIDARRVLDRARWQDAGWTVRAPGVDATLPVPSRQAIPA